jgi:hypothetical protein
MNRFWGFFAIQLSSYASILGLYFTLVPVGAPKSTLHWIVLIAGIALAIAVILRDLKNHLRSGPKVFADRARINEYMLQWIKSDGRTVIFSRDLSWATERPVVEELRKKATKRELIVCIEHSIELTDELATLGAKIVTYQHLGHVPRSRFTIVGFGREGARVAVGVPQEGRHVIQEFESGKHPYFAVAEDLVKFLGAAR